MTTTARKMTKKDLRLAFTLQELRKQAESGDGADVALEVLLSWDPAMAQEWMESKQGWQWVVDRLAQVREERARLWEARHGFPDDRAAWTDEQRALADRRSEVSDEVEVLRLMLSLADLAERPDAFTLAETAYLVGSWSEAWGRTTPEKKAVAMHVSRFVRGDTLANGKWTR